MRSGSGAVLLVGFALVVMLLSVAGTVIPPSIGMKQDPSQSFTDIAGSIREITYACGNFRGDDGDKLSYYNKTLTALSKQLKERGIMLEAYPMVASYKCSVLYILRSNDNSTYVEGFVSTDISTETAWKEYLVEGSSGSLSSLIIIPPALCFRDKGEGKKESSTHFLIGNPNPVRISVILKYIGNDEIKNWYVSFPGQGTGVVRDDDNDGDIEFYLNPMTEPKGKGVALGQRTVGDAFINIQHTTGQSGLVDKLTIIIPEYDFTQDIPIYWNECPVISWGQTLKSLRSGG
jgi:hypothetical protein